jgi:Activator of Hsp90 ATPase homolog 1-like protein
VTYLLEESGAGTRLTLRHTGFISPETCYDTCVGWETSLERLAELLRGASPAGKKSVIADPVD